VCLFLCFFIFIVMPLVAMYFSFVDGRDRQERELLTDPAYRVYKRKLAWREQARRRVIDRKLAGRVKARA
jgi:hypothetical protein